ncbi:hyalin-like isoform X2 [Patiria miniata]|nr:hyalin-like isoform X2 [Patiria miniata]
MPRSTDVDGDPAAVTCDKPRGTVFEGLKIIENIVQCTATDTSDPGSTSTCAFQVFVTPTFQSGCPEDIVQESSTVTFPKPIGNKNFGNTDLAPVTCSHESGDAFDAGLTVVTCRVTEATIDGLVARCSFRVTVGTLPEFEDRGSCNGTAVINTAPDEGSNTATGIAGQWARPTKAGGEQASCDPDPDTFTFPAGATSVTCTIADSDLPSLIDTCSFEVRVFPTFPDGCPETVVTDDGSTVDFSPPDAVDSAETTIAGTCDRASNETFPDGETTVQCSATDSVETTQTVTCSFVVAVGTAPEFESQGSCSSGPVNVPPDDGTMTATGLTGKWDRPTRVGGGEATCDPDPDTATFVGDSTEVVCTIQNATAPSITSTCNFDVGVFPAFEPDTLLGDPFRSPDPGTNYATYAYLDPRAKDSSGTYLPVACNPPSGTQFDGGTHEIKCVATDSTAGDDSTYTFTLSVAPTFKTLCPDDIIQASNPVSFVVPIGNDDSDGEPFPVNCTKNDGDDFQPGDTIVTCTVRHPVTKLVATCSFTVTIVVAPTFDASPVCDEDFDVQPAPGENKAIAVIWPERTAAQSDGNPANVTCMPDNGSDFEAGDTNVTCTAVDTRLPADTAPTTDCTFRVRVYPTFAKGCPNDTIQIPDLSGSTTIVTYEVPEGAIDSGGIEAANVTCDPSSGSAFLNDNTTVVTCTAVDSVTFGEATCMFTVRFLKAPTFNPDPPCDEDMNVPPSPESNMALAVVWPERTATQDDGDPADVTCIPASGSDFAGGDNNVTCTATDERAPEALLTTCEFLVRVYPTFVSGCPANLVVPPGEGDTTVVEFQIPEGAPDSMGEPANVTCDPDTGSALPNFAVTEVICTAVDSDYVFFPNVTTCSFKVTLGVAPTFNPDPPCDEDVNVPPSPESNMALAVVWPERTATQDDGNPADVTCTPASGSDFAGGDNKVTCTATDELSPNTLMTTCDFQVRVYPTFVSGCPANLVVPPGEGDMTLVEYEIPEGAPDSMGEPANVACDPDTGSAFPNNAVTEVICTAVDSDNVLFPNVTTCSFKVTVGDAPTFAQGCPADIIVAPDQTGEAVVTWEDVTGNEDSTGQPAKVQCDYESGATFSQTETVVTCTATDAGTGLTANCNFTVIIDSEPPVVECPESLNAPADPGTNMANVTWGDPAAADSYTPGADIHVVCIPGSGTIFPYGTTPVVCSAADSVNNIGMCSFEVQVTGAICPDQCPDNSVCTLQEDGESVCVCNTGYTGTECTNEDECLPTSPCHADAVCTNLDPPDFFSCQCKEGFYGDGMYTCERYFPAEYPDIPIPDGANDLQKIFLVVLAIADASASGCDPDVDKTSFECSIVVQTFKELVLPLYKRVSEVGFLDVMVNQTDLRKGSVVVPHTVSYNYSDQAIRAIRPEVFYQSSVEPDVEAGRLGNLLLEKNCQECTTPTDITDICSIVDKEAVTCPEKSVVVEDRNADTGMCVYKCISPCEENSEYCNGGVCSQIQNEDPVCSECPEGMTGPRCTIIMEPPYEPNIPLIVGLSVGLGGTVLLIVILNLLYCAFRGRCTKKELEEDGVDNGGVENFNDISMEVRTEDEGYPDSKDN